MAMAEQIMALAYTIWEQEGCSEGKREEHYYREKQILKEQEATSSFESGYYHDILFSDKPRI